MKVIHALQSNEFGWNSLKHESAIYKQKKIMKQIIPFKIATHRHSKPKQFNSTWNFIQLKTLALNIISTVYFMYSLQILCLGESKKYHLHQGKNS